MDRHQQLPYRTLRDEEILQLPVEELAVPDDWCLLFLWVTGRTAALGRQCMSHWGFQRVEDIVWVKRLPHQDGDSVVERTGHWLNHDKEHCLVGLRLPASAKGSGEELRGSPLEDVIVAVVSLVSC